MVVVVVVVVGGGGGGRHRGRDCYVIYMLYLLDMNVVYVYSVYLVELYVVDVGVNVIDVVNCFY